jgi:hypothetical protein
MSLESVLGSVGASYLASNPGGIGMDSSELADFCQLMFSFAGAMGGCDQRGAGGDGNSGVGTGEIPGRERYYFFQRFAFFPL